MIDDDTHYHCRGPPQVEIAFHQSRASSSRHRIIGNNT